MSAEPARHLRVVDANTGEMLNEHPEIARLQDEIKGLERALKAEIRRFENLKRDKEAEAQASEWWPVAVEVFRCWRRLTKHERAGWNADRFFLVEPYLRRRGYGPEMCVRAVAGIAFDHFTVQRKNGSTRHFDEWERVFKEAKEVEERANSAPKNWREIPEVHDALESIRLLMQSRDAPPPKLHNAQRPAG